MGASKNLLHHPELVSGFLCLPAIVEAAETSPGRKGWKRRRAGNMVMPQASEDLARIGA